MSTLIKFDVPLEHESKFFGARVQTIGMRLAHSWSYVVRHKGVSLSVPMIEGANGWTL